MIRLAEMRVRIRSVSGIADVCRALSTISAARLTRTRTRALALRRFAAEIERVLAEQFADSASASVGPAPSSAALSSVAPSPAPPAPLPLVAPDRVLVIILGPDRGLCGGHTAALCAFLAGLVADLTARGTRTVHLALKGRALLLTLRTRFGADVESLGVWPRSTQIDAVSSEILALSERTLADDEADAVLLVCTEFVSAIEGRPRVVSLLPQPAAAVAPARSRRWFFEPDRSTCLAELLRVRLRCTLLDAVLEAYASEQAARLVTMEEATERAEKTLAGLRVAYNRLRRESVTTETNAAVAAVRGHRW